MHLIQAQVSRTQVIPLSERWQRLILFVQKHPYLMFEKLVFKNGEPDLGVHEVELDGVKAKETVKF